MAYIPPHKRHTKDTNTPSSSLTPSLFVPSQPHRNPKHASKSDSGGRILYAKDSIKKWFVIPCNDTQDPNQDAQHLPFSIRLKEFSYLGFTKRKDGQKPMILVSADHHHHTELKESTNSIVKSPWMSIEEKIQQDLLTSLQTARTEMCKDGPERNVPRFVIRFGKILFHGSPSISLDNMKNSLAVENVLGRLNKQYYTNVPISFVEAILGEFIPKIGLGLHEEKERYYVKVFDKSRPHSTISCRCRVIKPVGELDVYKIELNEVRHLVVDISCLDKNLDLRLLLASKRILTSLSDDEKHSLTNIVKSAVIDSEVKGGLRWPLGKESLGDRYIVVGAWHTKVKTFKNSFIKLKIRDADRFDYRTATGEAAQEASLTMPDLTRQLRDRTLNLHPIPDIVCETLKLVWDRFLCWKGSFA